MFEITYHENIENIINLKDAGNSYLKIIKLSKDDYINNYPKGLDNKSYNELFKLKPEEKQKIKMFNKIIYAPRYSKSYLKSYKFSGIDHDNTNEEIPDRINQLYNESKLINNNLNQILVNWYLEDGYIGYHSDNESQLIRNSEIWSFSFMCSENSNKYFFLKNKFTNEIYKIKLSNNLLIIMGGNCQKFFKHSVPKTNDNSTRLNITFRCFKS